MASIAQLKAQAKYDKNNTKQVILKLNVRNDADVIAKLNEETNKQGYIKGLIRREMRNPENILSIKSIKHLLLPVVERYGIKSISLFGSYARNEAKPSSDVDILIDGGNYEGLVEYVNMIDEMKSALGRNVDVVTQTSLDNSKTESEIAFRRNVERDRLVLI